MQQALKNVLKMKLSDIVKSNNFYFRQIENWKMVIIFRLCGNLIIHVFFGGRFRDRIKKVLLKIKQDVITFSRKLWSKVNCFIMEDCIVKKLIENVMNRYRSNQHLSTQIIDKRYERNRTRSLNCSFWQRLLCFGFLNKLTSLHQTFWLYFQMKMFNEKWFWKELLYLRKKQ